MSDETRPGWKKRTYADFRSMCSALRTLRRHGAAIEADEDTLTIQWASANSFLEAFPEKAPPQEPPAPGDHVKVTRGAQTGATGTLETVHEDGTSTVRLRLRSAEATVRVPSEDVEACAPPEDWFPRLPPPPPHYWPVRQSSPRKAKKLDLKPEEKVLGFLISHGSMTVTEMSKRAKIYPSRAEALLEGLVADGRAEMRKNGRYYALPRDPRNDGGS